MRKFSLLALLISLTAVFAFAQEATDPLAEYKWIARPLVIFADSSFDPRFVRQMEMLAEDPVALEERDVVVLTDTDPSVYGPLRERLRALTPLAVLTAAYLVVYKLLGRGAHGIGSYLAPLSDPSLVFMAVRGGRLVRVDPPPVGGTLDLPSPW